MGRSIPGVNTNPIHPGCFLNAYKAGKTESGTQLYRCPDCNKRFTGKNRGKDPIGDRPMTDAERAKKYRQTPEGKASNLRGSHARRSRKLSVHHTSWEESDLKKRFAAFGNECVFCGDCSTITVDHFIPLSKGGSHCLGNLVPACRRCNVSKNKKDAETWYKSQPFYSRARWSKIQKIMKDSVHGQIPLF